ncbi:MAG TPA: hypothetical protein VD835_10635 [Pyrinomonadaceae bacterium]|nr:hypothetical protein [Pyrinomonadaceae bacterium]
MKSYRSALAAVVLTLAFSTSATANTGIIWTEKTPPPPLQATGIIWTEAADPAPEDDDLTEIALTLLQTLLPLL